MGTAVAPEMNPATGGYDGEGIDTKMMWPQHARLMVATKQSRPSLNRPLSVPSLLGQEPALGLP